ncbi:DUF4870 domain-containing protein [Thermogemmatispora carboxidivorans]|uniref:DUF4870 domain-containing protein n=1 Tax=Thermogemmatispora carboxidivorans TaxID=1382306 RepID=UPI00192E73AD|nr:DUF4870 domain-containing protein [Thermogemmatispora carboxidivorans]
MSWNPTPGQEPNQPGSGQYGGYSSQPGGAYGSPPNNPYGSPPSGASYGQAQYGQQPYGMSGAASALGPTSMGMEANLAAGLSYLVGWVTGLIFFLVEKQNRFVRFHAMQSIIWFGALTVVEIALRIVWIVPFLGLLAFCFQGLIGLLGFVSWIVLMIMAFQGKYFKLPVVGDYAERYASPPPTGTGF